MPNYLNFPPLNFLRELFVRSRGGRRKRSIYNTNITTPDYFQRVEGDEIRFNAAVQKANSTTLRRFDDLQESYNMLYRNDVVFAATQQRFNVLANKRFEIQNASGEVDEGLTLLLAEDWFLKLLRLIHESEYFWYSIIILYIEKGEIKDVNLVDRRNCFNETGKWEIGTDKYGEQRIRVDDYPDDIIVATLGDIGTKGLLEVVAKCVYSLRKKDAAQRSIFYRLFAPLFHIRRSTAGSAADTDFEAQLKAGGATSGTMVTPSSYEINVINQNNTGHQSINDSIKMDGERIQRVIVGQTLTASGSSSRSQGEVHERTMSEIGIQDTKRTIAFLNRFLIPRMRRLKYKLKEGNKIGVQNIRSDKELREDTLAFMKQGVVPDKDWLQGITAIQIDEINPVNKAAGREEGSRNENREE